MGRMYTVSIPTLVSSLVLELIEKIPDQMSSQSVETGHGRVQYFCVVPQHLNR